MSKRHENEEPEEDDAPSAPGWMTTYGDMMTLLMTFFILIMSFATIEIDKFKAAMGSLKGAFGVLGDSDEVHTDYSWFSPFHVSQIRQNVFDEVEELREMIAEEQLQEMVEIVATDNEVMIRIRDKVLFDLGSANLRPEFLPVLRKLITSIEGYSKEIKVAGHTDDLPIRTPEFPSNWELSMERALSVVRYCVNVLKLDPAKFSAAGYSEYHPIVPNTSPENRARNRRVEIFMKR